MYMCACMISGNSALYLDDNWSIRSLNLSVERKNTKGGVFHVSICTYMYMYILSTTLTLLALTLVT
jgi:hypothetical protein